MQEIEQLSAKELQAIAAKKRDEELIQLRDDLSVICEERGYTMEDVISVLGANVKRPLAVKYRHPSTGETWTGRGRTPIWVRKWLSTEGNLLEDLAV